MQCAETNLAPVQLHQDANIEHEALVGREAVHGHVIDLRQVEGSHNFISRAFKAISIIAYCNYCNYCIKLDIL